MEKSKRGKGRGTIVDSNEEEMPVPKVEEVADLKNSVPIEEPKRKVKSNVQKEKKSKVLSEEDKEKYAFELINMMREVYKSDLISNQQMKPATKKIQSIDDISSKAIKKDMQDVLINMGILKELKIWLEPLPDNTMPNIKIKRSILDLLFNLKISKEDLLASGIGKIVHFYSKNSKETVEIRKKATQLVKKWKGQIIKEEVDDM